MLDVGQLKFFHSRELINRCRRRPLRFVDDILETPLIRSVWIPLVGMSTVQDGPNSRRDQLVELDSLCCLHREAKRSIQNMRCHGNLVGGDLRPHITMQFLDILSRGHGKVIRHHNDRTTIRDSQLIDRKISHGQRCSQIQFVVHREWLEGIVNTTVESTVDFLEGKIVWATDGPIQMIHIRNVRTEHHLCDLFSSKCLSFSFTSAFSLHFLYLLNGSGYNQYSFDVRKFVISNGTTSKNNILRNTQQREGIWLRVPILEGIESDGTNIHDITIRQDSQELLKVRRLLHDLIVFVGQLVATVATLACVQGASLSREHDQLQVGGRVGSNVQLVTVGEVVVTDAQQRRARHQISLRSHKHKVNGDPAVKRRVHFCQTSALGHLYHAATTQLDGQVESQKLGGTLTLFSQQFATIQLEGGGHVVGRRRGQIRCPGCGLAIGSLLFLILDHKTIFAVLFSWDFGSSIGLINRRAVHRDRIKEPLTQLSKFRHREGDFRRRKVLYK
mmetsp:Transcript_18891/g.56636  ORF Transcript_18891/g.56636 Transcript_18891/m.56636 type:complete len:502 (+) Transcript_18891:1264-2769(+)